MLKKSIDIAVRKSYGRVLGSLVRELGNIDDAEDALHDAITRALSHWRTSIPENPSAWLLKVARNIWIDRQRRATVHHKWQIQEDVSSPIEQNISYIDDDLLRLVFTCCHPALSSPAKNTLTLRYVLGFTTNEIARAYFTSKSNIEKRLIRAKSKIKNAGILYEVPGPNHLRERLDAVCDVIYLLFNEGYSVLDPQRDIDMCGEAICLARHLARMFRSEKEVHSLLALLLLHHSRIEQRIDENNMFKPLSEQNRTRWNQSEIQEGLTILEHIFLQRKLPGPYQLQAAISAEHCRAKQAEHTRWNEIISLYGYLDRHYPSPVIKLNSAVAMACAGYLNKANSVLIELATEGKLDTHQPYFVARAFVAEKMGNRQDAIKFYKQAVAYAPTEPECEYLQYQLDRLCRLSLVS